MINLNNNSGRRHKRYSQMSEINVTPFVDVMLVLLIIFMVAAPMLTVGVPIELPKSAAQPLATEQEEPLTIALSSDGKIVLQNIEIKNENLIEKLVAVAEERTNNKVFLRADASVNYAAVMEVMGALNAAGFNNIGLVTDAGGPKLDGSDP